MAILTNQLIVNPTQYMSASSSELSKYRSASRPSLVNNNLVASGTATPNSNRLLVKRINNLRNPSPLRANMNASNPSLAFNVDQTNLTNTASNQFVNASNSNRNNRNNNNNMHLNNDNLSYMHSTVSMSDLDGNIITKL